MSPHAYCAAFADAFAARSDARVPEDSVRVKARSPLWRWVSNVFQRRGSRLVAGYGCGFEVVAAGNGPRREWSVDIVTVETLEFAEYTQWEKLQVVPIQLVVDDRGNAGWGVFKYLTD